LRILADENVRRALVHALRDAGHDVVWISEVAPEAPDLDVFDLAVREQRTLLTGDLDFADIVYRHKRPGLPGLVLIRVDIPDTSKFLTVVLDAWQQVPAWEGLTTVIEAGRVRQRALP
jgi:predicted nuclease of predicted toxin-antitoxin system